jgi:hypothetical protein
MLNVYGHEPLKEDIKNAYNIVIGKTEAKRPDLGVDGRISEWMLWK